MEDHATVRWGYWVPSDYWREPEAAAVDPWQACALSVDIEPKGMAADRTDYSIGPFINAMWDREHKRNTLDEFERRLSLLSQDSHDPRFFKLRSDGKLLLHEFVSWMKEKKIRDFPWELAKLDTKPEELAERDTAKNELDASETDTNQRFPKSNSGIETPEAETPAASPDVPTEPDPKPRRRDILSHAVEVAFQNAETKQTPDVFIELRKLAEAKTAPFIGKVADDGALLYQDDDGNHSKLTKEALRKRIKRMPSKK